MIEVISYHNRYLERCKSNQSSTSSFIHPNFSKILSNMCDTFLHILFLCRADRSSHRRCSVKKGVLKNFENFTGNTCVGVSF